MQKVYLKQQDDKSFLVCGVINFSSVLLLLNSSMAVFKKTDRIVVDLANLSDTNSSVIALVLEWQRFAMKNNKTLTLRNIPAAMISLISISNLEELAPLWSN